MNERGAILDGLRPFEVQALLRKLGWVPSFIGEHSAVWTHPEGGPRLLVPAKIDFEDYGDRLGELLSTLQNTLELSFERIVHEVEEATHDTLRLRDDRSDLRWSTTLGEGQKLLKSAHRAWKDAANIVSKKETKYVQEFMSSLRLGQTERGSYIVRVMSPIHALEPEASTQEGFFPPVPFERLVTEGLSRAVSTLAAVVHETRKMEPASPSFQATFGAAKQAGVTRGLCLALADSLSEPGTEGLEVEISWAGAVPAPQGNRRKGWTRFSVGVAPILMAGAEVLRTSFGQRLRSVEGWVVHLRRAPTDEHGTVTILCVLQGASSARPVRVALAGEAYEAAATAHRDQRVVRCEGDVREVGKRLVLENPTAFRLVGGTKPLNFDDEHS